MFKLFLSRKCRGILTFVLGKVGANLKLMKYLFKPEFTLINVIVNSFKGEKVRLNIAGYTIHEV